MTELHLMTVNAAALRIGVHPETIRRAIRRGQLSCYRRPGCTRIAPEHLQAYLDASLCLAHGSTDLILSNAEATGASSGGSKENVAGFRRGQRLKAALDRPSRILRPSSNAAP